MIKCTPEFLKRHYHPVEIKQWKGYIIKDYHGWEICALEVDDAGFPKRIGFINTSGIEGPLNNMVNLGWSISKEYQGRGIMKELVSKFVKEFKPGFTNYAAAIFSDNLPSLGVAKAAGFTKYQEENGVVFLKTTTKGKK